jgi:uncharacterized membrane protein
MNRQPPNQSGATHGSRASRASRDGRLAAALLGFALGGFFDGIVLHQVLQWHHLLSEVRTGSLAFQRTQVMVDGLFHAGMYGLALVGLVLLFRSRITVSHGRLWSVAAVSFGIWHVLDAVLSHWLLGIHRIRTDVPEPLLWDIGWLVAFGLLPMLAGWMGLRRTRPSPAPPDQTDA